MAERLSLGTEERVLKIGQSFTNPKSKAFHTVRYGAGTTRTVFKGSQRPYTKECVLIIDRVTGEITLEKLACNIQVKKTRSEINKAVLSQVPDRAQSANNDRSGAGVSNSARSGTSPVPNVVGHRVSSKTRVATSSRRPDRPITQLMPKHSPLRASPSHPSPNASMVNQRSPGRSRESFGSNESHNSSTLASLPMIGIDDFADLAPPTSQASQNSRLAAPAPNVSVNNGKSLSPLSDHSVNENQVGTISDSSSSSSDSDSDSDSPDNGKIKNGHTNTNSGKVNGHDLTTLDEDLCLSESGSDSE